MNRILPVFLLIMSCDVVPTTTPIPEYDRSEWGRWIDADGDCQDTRQEVLIAESLTPVEFEDDRKCKVVRGTWRCPYTGETFTNPSDLDVDHVVALREVHFAGGWAWDRDRKRAYFNDLDNPDTLAAVSASTNRSKGARGPDEWVPPDEEARCTYLKARMSVFKSHSIPYDCDRMVELVVRHCR